MTLLESVRYGYLTIRQLSEAITSNLILAEKLDITVHTYFNKNKIFTGVLKRNGNEIFHKLYTDQFQHMRIARFHGEINEFMKAIELDEARAVQDAEKMRKRKEEEAARMAELEEVRNNQKMKWQQGKGFVEPNT